uniref:NHS-like 2 n=1 Tax=Gasterosteus aculeatus aculeatus TaxID=481459 RepID=A0AAQ4Q3P7_GASAC
MDTSGLLCSNTAPSSWNGPKGSTFSPGAWNEPYSYSANKGPAVPPKQHSVLGGAGGGARDGVMLVSSGQSVVSHSSSFTSMTNPSGRGGSNTMATMGKRSETEGAAEADGGRGGVVTEALRGRERSARSIAAANAFKFRERSLSTPTDPGSFGFTEADRQQQHHNFLGSGENYALLYPRGSSEDSTSTGDTISVTASDYSADGRLRLRSRSISLKKSKRKPPPPVRSVSLMKNLGEAEGQIRRGGSLYRDGRPKSLLEVQAPEREGEPELTFPNHWQLGEWKNDPYRSLSGSSTATGTTVIECMKVRGSSESLLDSPSTSRATSPSQLSMDTDIKAPSPFKPLGLMSPSSGYSSQSETPTPTVPLSHMAGHGTIGTQGCKLRPKIPERKSSLPSPKDPSGRSRLSFEMPGNAHMELSSIKPKPKASRRHSDTSMAAKPGKVSPSSSQTLPVVTQNELKTIRLRSVSRGDLEDCPDGASDTIEEEQHGRELDEDPSPPPTLPKPKPPVAVKPPLPKRPINLLLKSPSPSSTSPLALDSPPDDSAFNEKTILHIAEETDEAASAGSPSTHTTEDLFTIIHRSKRKVLGRKEPTDSFGSRQSLVSPVKHSTSGGDLRNMTLGSQRSSSRNENFMALLQKKGSKSTGGGARVSAMELLKSTNPLARRVTEFSTPSAASGEEGDEASR